MIKPEHLRDIIRLSLRPIGKWSADAEEIMMMIAAHESGLGKHLKQIGKGPARGLYGMECGHGRTEPDLWKNYLSYRRGLVQQIKAICGVSAPNPLQIQFNHIYSSIMCRIKLLQCPGALPDVLDVDAMARYAKDFYNTAQGAATPEKYANDYLRLVLI